MEKSPDHGPHAVEQVPCLVGLSPVDAFGPDEEPEVHICFFRLGVRDAPVVKLIGDRFQRRRYTPREFESDARAFDGSSEDFEFLFGFVVMHGGLRFVHVFRDRL